MRKPRKKIVKGKKAVKVLPAYKSVADWKKERDLKLAQERDKWAHKIQTKPLPSWTEAFDYAYELGFQDAIKGF